MLGFSALVTGLASAGSLRPAALLPVAMLLAIVWLHQSFYRFFARVRGAGFALGVLPLHLLFFLYSGLAIPLGYLAYRRDRRQALVEAAGPGRILVHPLSPEPGLLCRQAEETHITAEDPGESYRAPVTTHTTTAQGA